MNVPLQTEWPWYIFFFHCTWLYTQCPAPGSTTDATGQLRGKRPGDISSTGCTYPHHSRLSCLSVLALHVFPLPDGVYGDIKCPANTRAFRVGGYDYSPGPRLSGVEHSSVLSWSAAQATLRMLQSLDCLQRENVPKELRATLSIHTLCFKGTERYSFYFSSSFRIETIVQYT